MFLLASLCPSKAEALVSCPTMAVWSSALSCFRSSGPVTRRPVGSKMRSNCSGSPARHRAPAQLRRSQNMSACTDPRARELRSAGSCQEPRRLRGSASLSEGSFCERKRLDVILPEYHHKSGKKIRTKAAEKRRRTLLLHRSMARTALMEDGLKRGFFVSEASPPESSVRGSGNKPSILVCKQE